MINQLNSSGAQPTSQMFGQGLTAYAGNPGAMSPNPYGQVLGGAMGSLSQAMSNPEFMKMLSERLKSYGGSTSSTNFNDTYNPDTAGTFTTPVADQGAVEMMPLA